MVDPPKDTRARILDLLQRRGPQTANQLAAPLGITAVAVRQHLAVLCGEGVTQPQAEASEGAVGRPARRYALTERSRERFADSHKELTVGLLEAAREAFGEEGLVRLVKARTDQQVKEYRRRMPEGAASLRERVERLARIRSEEGYVAACENGPKQAVVLVENHCPIYAGAKTCQGLCQGELELFRRVLGRSLRVERTEHMLTGARRCAYRIEPR
ncbi:MAG: helix-turn-helix transcriptional regulator [Planctomycetota bacterium]|jgi:predicted ArsR family transcriptional regulator